MRPFLLFMALLTNVGGVQAQYDSTYYTSYAKKLTCRFYFSQKYTTFSFRNIENGVTLNYKPNTTLNMGVGATYKWATLNLAYGFGFLNSNSDKGETQYLDLQWHVFARKFTIDMLGQFYKGFYLDNEKVTKALGHYYTRPDLAIYEIGVSSQYILNHRRFTYRAAYFQSEWQKKSAGTFLLGAEFYVGQAQADSTIVPKRVNESAADTKIQQMNFMELGPNLGYAYSLVIRHHFFVTASASTSYTYGINSVRNINGGQTSTGFGPNTQLKLFAGYNSATWAVSVTYVNSKVVTDSKGSNRSTEINTGNIRANLVYRFKPGTKTRKALKLIDGK